MQVVLAELIERERETGPRGRHVRDGDALMQKPSPGEAWLLPRRSPGGVVTLHGQILGGRWPVALGGSWGRWPVALGGADIECCHCTESRGLSVAGLRVWGPTEP